MNRSFWLCLAITSLFVSCDPPNKLKPSSIVGYWSVSNAFRDKRETKLLMDVFFQFDSTGNMLTNLPNTAEGATKYQVKGDKIIQQTANPLAYVIQGVDDSIMVLLLEMNNTPFEIHLKKTAPPAPPAPDELEKDSLY